MSAELQLVPYVHVDQPVNALESLFTGALTGERQQRIHTPPSVLHALALLWPAGIALDPAGSPDGIVIAERIVIPPANGLLIPWPKRTYCNPPFDDLEPWLRKFARAWEVVLLLPVRTHRGWFRAAMRVATQVVYLDSLTFVGFASSFPAPLCLLYRGAGDLQSIAERCGLADNRDDSAQLTLLGGP